MVDNRYSEQWAAYVQELGDQVHDVRMTRGMSQEQVAYAAGLTRYTFQRLERGLGTNASPANPTLFTLVSVAGALDVGVEDLLPARDLGDPAVEQQHRA